MTDHGGGQRRVTSAGFSTGGYEEQSTGNPVWSPDGTKLAFSAGLGGSYEADLYIVGVDGSGLRRLPTAPETTSTPPGGSDQVERDTHEQPKQRAECDRPPARARPARRQAAAAAGWALDDHARALEQLRLLASELEHAYPGAAGSLREGMEETLTLTRLGVTGNLKRTLESTNPCESMLEIVRRTQRNVKRWSSGEMALRWTAAGMLEAERQFRKIIGYRDLATLVVAIERDHDRRRAPHTTTKEAAIVLSA